MKPEMFVVIGTVIALTVLVKFLIVKIAQSANVSRAAWLLSIVMGALWAFFIVFSQMKAAEAERQFKFANSEAERQAELAHQQAEAARIAQALAEEAQAEAVKQAQIAYEASEELKRHR